MSSMSVALESIHLLASKSDLDAIRPEMAKAAQAVYDKWCQDADGMDPELGTGGICDEVASEISNVINSRLTVVSEIAGFNDHAYLVVLARDGVLSVDIAASTYEIGAGFVWEKINGVTFKASDVSIETIDRRPESAPLYFDPESLTTGMMEVARAHIRRRATIQPTVGASPSV